MENKEKFELVELIKNDISTIAKKVAEGAKAEAGELIKELESKIERSLEGMVSKEDFDKMETQFKKSMNELRDKNAKDMTFDVILKDAISSSEELKSLDARRSKSAVIEIQKNPAILTAATSLGATNAANAFAVNNNQLIVPIARRQRHVRELIGMGATDQAVFPYLRETAKQGAVGVQNPEGASKAQTEYKSDLVFATESTIAHFQKIGRQTLSNVRGLASFIQLNMVKDLLVKEDQQLLFGTGLSGEVLGIFASGSVPGLTGFGVSAVGANIYDLIAACAAKLAGLEYNANMAVVNPVDYWQMVITKDKDESYVNNVVFDSQASILYVFGIPVIASTAVPVGFIGIGDSSYVMPMQREGITLRFSEEDDKNFQQNLVTARVEERILQAVLRNDAFIYGEIATGLAEITPAVTPAV